uniref:Protein FAR1-related sequence 5-like n=1 Tax=Tanacetum cinerariifolium TaxID=118510 RepID=A0A6L2J0Q0_TANCI|nr:protein FAR1-related sequence 5-like [Tanacetum cinerariifolium]
MVLIVPEEAVDVVTHSGSNVVQEQNNQTLVLSKHVLDMDVVHDDPNDANDVDVYDIDPEFIPTPKRHKYWVPNVPVGEKPKKFNVFNTFDDAYYIYKVYTAKATFNVCKSRSKHHKGQITHKYVLCNRAGKPKKTVETNTLNEDGNQDGLEDENEDEKKENADRLPHLLIAKFDKVRGMPVDWNIFRRGVNKFIDDRDAQMLVDKMLTRHGASPSVSFLTSHNKRNDKVFVPFTEAFLKVHGKQPPLGITDQDGVLWKAVQKIFTQSHHRLFCLFEKMRRDVLTVGSTMRIPLLYRGEYSQWVERFMNYLEEQTDGEAMINSIKNEWKQYATMMRQNKNLMDINIDALYNLLKQNQGDVNDSMGLKKKTVVVTSDPLALGVEKTKVSKRKEKVVVSSNSKGSDADDFSELKKITALLAKDFNQRKFYSKPTNNNLRTSSTSQSANKKQEFVKTDVKKVVKKDDEKKQDMRKVKCYNCKKE